MTVPPAPVRFPSQRPLAPSIASVTSVANDKGDNEMIPGAVHRSPDICLTIGKNPARRPSDEGCATSHGIKWGPLTPKEVSRIAQRVRKGKVRKERIGRGSDIVLVHYR